MGVGVGATVGALEATAGVGATAVAVATEARVGVDAAVVALTAASTVAFILAWDVPVAATAAFTVACVLGIGALAALHAGNAAANKLTTRTLVNRFFMVPPHNDECVRLEV